MLEKIPYSDGAATLAIALRELRRNPNDPTTLRHADEVLARIDFDAYAGQQNQGKKD